MGLRRGRRKMSGEATPGSGAEVERGGHSPLPPPEDELRERDERGLDRDAERWIAEWGGNE